MYSSHTCRQNREQMLLKENQLKEENDRKPQGEEAYGVTDSMREKDTVTIDGEGERS